MAFCTCSRFKKGSQAAICGGCGKQQRPRGSKFCVVCRVNVGAESKKRASYMDAALGVVQYCYGCSLTKQPALLPYKKVGQPRNLRRIILTVRAGVVRASTAGASTAANGDGGDSN